MQQRATRPIELPLPRRGEPEAPGGLWNALVTTTLADSHGDVWRALERRLLQPAQAATAGIWGPLTERTDPTAYRPQAIPDVAEEQLVEGETAYTVICSPRGNYLRLTPIQRDLWHQMDGAHTVAQLATQAFLKHHQLVPVGDLVQLLKREGFLMDRPTDIYSGLAQGIEQRTAEGWGRRVLHVLAGKTFQLPRIDETYGAIYRVAGGSSSPLSSWRSGR